LGQEKNNKNRIIFMKKDYANYTNVMRSELSEDESNKIRLTNKVSPDSTISLSDDFLETKADVVQNTRALIEIINDPENRELSDAVKTISGLFKIEAPLGDKIYNMTAWTDSLNYPCVINGNVFSNKNEFCEYNKENDEKALRELEDNIEYLSSQRELKKGPYSFKRSIVSDEGKISLKSEPSEDSQ
jgi:hypothetical protein